MEEVGNEQANFDDEDPDMEDWSDVDASDDEAQDVESVDWDQTPEDQRMDQPIDIDQDGQVTAFSDGLMLIRSLLGNAFPADALTDKALSSDSPYYNEANPWQSVQDNIDALAG